MRLGRASDDVEQAQSEEDIVDIFRGAYSPKDDALFIYDGDAKAGAGDFPLVGVGVVAPEDERSGVHIPICAELGADIVPPRIVKEFPVFDGDYDFLRHIVVGGKLVLICS